MYEVTIYHHRKTYTRGDVDAEFVMTAKETFKTRTAAKAYIENKLKGKPAKDVYRDYHKGDEASRCYYYTGYTWFNECTGDDEKEYYQYTLKKAKVGK